MIFGISIKDILAFIGGAVLVLTFLKLLLDVIPKLNSFRSYVYRSISGRLKYRALEKRAIASNIEEVINNSVSFLQKELPVAWISKAKIDWVREEIPEELEEEELILRIRPFDDQDQNLMNGIFYFFTKALFRGIKEVVPHLPRKAAVLQLSRRTISKNHPYALSDFERRYLDTAIELDEEIAYYLGHYNTMDSRGYFTGVYIREVADLAERVRYSPLRSQIVDELREIVNQIASFIKQYPNHPDELWYRKSEISSYAFLLVARPLPWRRVDTYVNKALYRANNDIERLYVLGADQEKSFVRKVIGAIAKRTEYSLLEVFEQNKDYRGESGGICAIFDLSAATRETDREVARLFDQ